MIARVSNAVLSWASEGRKGSAQEKADEADEADEAEERPQPEIYHHGMRG